MTKLSDLTKVYDVKAEAFLPSANDQAEWERNAEAAIRCLRREFLPDSVASFGRLGYDGETAYVALFRDLRENEKDPMKVSIELAALHHDEMKFQPMRYYVAENGNAVVITNEDGSLNKEALHSFIDQAYDALKELDEPLEESDREDERN